MSTAPQPNFGLATFYAAGSSTYNELLSDGDDVVSRKGQVASGGGKINRGQIVHFDPPTGNITTAVLGTAAPNAIVAENCDATAATVSCLVYVSGKFKADAVLWPPTGGHADISDVLRDYGILLESVLYTDGTYVKATPDEAAAKQAQERLEAARQRVKEAADQQKQAQPPDQTDQLTDSVWAYMTQQEREQQPNLDEPVIEPMATPVLPPKPPEEHRP